MWITLLGLQNFCDGLNEVDIDHCLENSVPLEPL